MAVNTLLFVLLLSLIEVQQKAAVITAEPRFSSGQATVPLEVPTPPVSKPLAGKSFFVTGGGWDSVGLTNQANAKRLVVVMGGTVLPRTASNTDATAHLLRGSGQVKLHGIPQERQHSPDWLKNQCDLAGVDITLPVCISLRHT